MQVYNYQTHFKIEVNRILVISAILYKLRYPITNKHLDFFLQVVLFSKEASVTTVESDRLVRWTHLACKTLARHPAAKGAALEVPWKFSMHPPPMSVVT